MGLLFLVRSMEWGHCNKKTGPTVGIRGILVSLSGFRKTPRDVVSIDNWQPRSFCVCRIEISILKWALLSVSVFLFWLHIISNTAFALLNVKICIPHVIVHSLGWFLRFHMYSLQSDHGFDTLQGRSDQTIVGTRGHVFFRRLCLISLHGTPQGWPFSKVSY